MADFTHIDALASSIIKQFEGLALKPYKCPAGVLTIGYGHTGSDVKDNMEITVHDAITILMKDIKKYRQSVYNEVGSICNDEQIAALTSFCFNVGIGNFLKSTLLKTIKKNPSDLDGIKAQFMRWVNAGGNRLQGLILRRTAEYTMYSKLS